MLSKFKLIFDKGVKESLYFHPPIATKSSKKIITPTNEPTDVLLINNLFSYNFLNLVLIYI